VTASDLKRRKRYAVVGLSNRAIGQYVLPLIGCPKLPEYGDYSRYGEVVALCDIDERRVQGFNEAMGSQIPFHRLEDLEGMIQTHRPDVLIVTGPDGTHVDPIVTGLRHNLEVLTEKPMVIDGAQAQRVIKAQAASRGRVWVGFNYRYTQMHMQLKRMLMQGKVGRVTNVEMVWNIDTYHGSSYFYRWNRDRRFSGGLCISKSCHHFDLINWWLNDRPEQVFAYGALNYYGDDSPHKPVGDGLNKDEQREGCLYHQHWNAPWLEAPKDDHLIAHERVFNLPYEKQYSADDPLYIYDKAIDIEDTYSAVVRYRGGASLTYSANFSAPWEGYTLGINGTHGRIEATHLTAPSRCPFPTDGRESIHYYPLFGQRATIEVRPVSGGHGGADPMMKHDMFVKRLPESQELGLLAGPEAGADAVLVGEAVWRSIAANRPIEIDALLGQG